MKRKQPTGQRKSPLLLGEGGPAKPGRVWRGAEKADLQAWKKRKGLEMGQEHSTDPGIKGKVSPPHPPPAGGTLSKQERAGGRMD